jgi:hypothetical protein
MEAKRCATPEMISVMIISKKMKVKKPQEEEESVFNIFPKRMNLPQRKPRADIMGLVCHV